MIAVGRPLKEDSFINALIEDEPYYKVAPVTIVPTTGDELFLNNTFVAWTLDNPDNWTVVGEVGVDPEISEVGPGEGHGGVGLGRCNIYASAAGGLPRIQQAIFTVGHWYLVSVDIDTVISGAIGIFDGDTTWFYFRNIFVDKSVVLWAKSVDAIILGYLATKDVTLVSASCKKLSDHIRLWDHGQSSGQFSVNFSQDILGSVALVFEYTDENNYTCIASEGDNNLWFGKVVAGVGTKINEYTVVYGDNKTVSIKRYAAGTMDVLYDGVTLASGVAATGNTGTQAGVVSGSVGNVINWYEWDGRGY